MSLNHLIAKSLMQIHAASALLTADLPGHLHYGTRVAAQTPRPFGLFTVEETDRESNSGAGALVNYTLTLKIFGRQRFKAPGDILQDFAVALSPLARLPAVTPEHADVMSILGMGGTMLEDPAEEYGKDCVVSDGSWSIQLNESLAEIGA